MQNLTMLTDLYQLTMLQGYYENGISSKSVVFEMFYRKNPFGNGFAIFAGLEQLIDYIKNLKFSEDDISYLKQTDMFNDEFLSSLQQFKFSGDIDCVVEGSVVFPNEPLIRVTAPLNQAQFIESALLNIINHQTLIATKAARVVLAADGDDVVEFGLRRAQGPDGGIYGARAAIIGGCSATSNALAAKMFNLPVIGTHAHSWVMNFGSELEAFRAYTKAFRVKPILLVDTYDTLDSGVPNAIKVFDEFKPKGAYGIRLDSGDLAYLSKQSRRQLDEAGYKDAIISASSDLDEYIIADLKRQEAKINLWGVGTKLITASDNPALGGVYKIVAQEDSEGEYLPKIKLSDNIAKVTTPGIKKIIRVYDKESGKIKADVVALFDERFNANEEWIIRDPLARWKKMELKGGEYSIREMLVPIFKDGKCVYKTPSVMEIQKYAKAEMETLWDEYKRLLNPEVLPVDLSDDLYMLKEQMVDEVMVKGEW
ncbi:MAG: nicotinate phosphoribosyltransferase [Epulopiscium sp. Nuni2H_MBin001]|nr:MAG: nicotinate phosphoribosyltransferase [Epulopiscium sp. Nuni2H_MBin001]